MEQEIIKAATDVATSTANKGLEKLTDLVFSKKLRQQRRLDLLSTIQDQKDAELIQQGLAEFRDGKFLLIADQFGNPTSPLGLILAQNNQNQSENLGKCLSRAYEHLSEKSSEEINDEQISETFFNKWINYGKEVSEEELHDLWGHILAEEIATPNSINYLVLNTISLVSRHHLEAFNSLLPFIVDHCLLCNPKKSATENYSFIKPNLLDELIDLNIIRGLSDGDVYFRKNLHRATQADKSFPSIRIDKNHFIAFHLNDHIDEPIIYFYNLTTVGQKLYEIALQNINIKDYFSSLINNLKNLTQLNSFESAELIYINNATQRSLLKIKI